MKKCQLLFGTLLCFTFTFAQDKSPLGSSSIKMRFSGVPTEHISESDTIYQNQLSISPIIDLRTETGWGITYSPSILFSGNKSGIYMHAISAGYESWGRKSFDIAFDYTRYIFTHNISIPYSPINNEIFFLIDYSKTWLRPVVAISLGFGKDSNASTIHEVGLSTGVSHDFDWKNKGRFSSIEITPSALVNAGTNEYFSFLQVTKYISNSHHFTSYVKNKGKNKSGNPSFEFSNLELNMDTNLEKGAFSMHPNGSIFFPMGTGTDKNISAYAELKLEYSF